MRRARRAFGARGLASATSLGLALAFIGLVAPSAQAEIGFTNFSNTFINQNGTPTTQAGAHPWEMVTKVDFSGAEVHGGESLKDVQFELPSGLVGDPNSVSQCLIAEFLILRSGTIGTTECPTNSQIGTFEVSTFGPGVRGNTVPLYNLVPPPGSPAEFAASIVGVPILFQASVRPGGDGLTVNVRDNSQAIPVFGSEVVTWGVPADPSHDSLRGPCLNIFGASECSLPSTEEKVRPFLTMPTTCSPTPPVTRFNIDSWQNPGRLLPNDEPDLSDPNWKSATPAPNRDQQGNPVAISGCDSPGFKPTFRAEPTTSSAYSPTGLNTTINFPLSGLGNPTGIAESDLNRAVVTLPEGMSLNPSAGAGLSGCTVADLAAENLDTPPGSGCPNSAKVGDLTVETPLLPKAVPGSLYVAQPHENPFGSLLALYLVVKDPQQGVLLKLAGKVEPNLVTGQLTTTFENLPQLPFAHFTLSFAQGQTSPLITPPTCGAFAATADLSPWSQPAAVVTENGPFQVTSGVGAGPCPTGAPPFHPGLSAGSYSNGAGSYSPFYVRLSRNDGEQEFTHFQVKLPPGLTGKLAGIPYCPDAAIAAAKAREHEGGGAQEEANPSCPKASEVGHTLVEAGVGTVLAQAPGKVYLAGSYHGSQLSLVSITAAKVGPFDLGTVVVRFALKIDPETAQVSVDGQGSDPIPHIVDGIPVHVRNIRTYMDRPEFVLNPTSCKKTSTASTVLGSGSDFVSAADDQPVTVSSPFQAANCAALGFKPKLALSLKGGTKRGATPAFKAVLTARKGDANIGAAQVTLPSSEYLEQAHIGTVCTRVQFAAGTVPGEKCPAASIYGRARAITPILSEPLEGPVYLRSSSHPLPDLVAALNNKQVNIDLDGHIDAVHEKGSEVSRIRNSFEAVPDAPVTKFTLEMRGGKKGLLTNSTDLCKGTHRALAAFTGQNGKLHEFNPKLQAQCGKKGKKK